MLVDRPREAVTGVRAFEAIFREVAVPLLEAFSSVQRREVRHGRICR